MRRRSLAVLVPAALIGAASAAPAQTCDPGNGGITLPEGFCATVFADSVGAARHLVVSPNGDVFVALRNRRDARGGVLALRDTTGDGRADVRVRFGEDGGTGIDLVDGRLYFAPDDAVLAWRLPPGSLRPAGAPDTIAYGLTSRRQHAAKSIAVSPDGALFVNIGAPSNACQADDRQPGSPGLDPCPMLEEAGGIWRFDAGRERQSQAQGERWATGLRNVVALAWNPVVDALYGLQHGRDQLFNLWPDLYDERDSAEKPSEELFRIDRGDDFGWPYCYHDPELGRKVLAPEYGGDGREVGRCAAKEDPLLAFPAHWAPNALLFYTGSAFPPRYRDGAFIAFHGSWNRAPLPQQGYNVVFVPFRNGSPAGGYDVFAAGFAGEEVQPGAADHRPTGLAQGPEGALYVSDDSGGRIWRIVYRGR